MVETKKILLIGQSGCGKSALANVVTNTDKFEESEGSTSKTKFIQSEEFEEDGNKCCIIDTPGIGDTKLKDKEVLDIIAEAVYLVKEGVNQVFFVTDGRFDQYEMATYNLLRTIIFDKDITKHTTIVRTRFEDFRNRQKCQDDIDLMIKKAHEKKTELEKEIIAEKQKLKKIPCDSVEHKKLFERIEKLNQQLSVTNSGEIIESCQGRIIHVDNPSLEVVSDKALSLERKKNKRVKSREKLLEHLKNDCQDTYKPPKLAELSSEIVQFMEKKKKSERELEEELKKLEEKSARRLSKLVANSVQSSITNNVQEITIGRKEDLSRPVVNE